MPSFTLRRHLWPNRSRQRHRRERALTDPAAAIEAADIDTTAAGTRTHLAQASPRAANIAKATLATTAASGARLTVNTNRLPSVVSQQPAHEPPRQRKAHKKSVRLRIVDF